jgi:acylphosphatase
MADPVRVHVLVSGRVQGVAFRAYTADEARRLGVRGWVRNLADGRVEVEAEGERADVEALVAFCRRGPPAASVERADVTWAAFRGDLGPFATRH